MSWLLILYIISLTRVIYPITYMPSPCPHQMFISKLTYLEPVLDLLHNICSPFPMIPFSVNDSSILPLMRRPHPKPWRSWLQGVLFIFPHTLSNLSTNLLALFLKYIWDWMPFTSSFSVIQTTLFLAWIMTIVMCSSILALAPFEPLHPESVLTRDWWFSQSLNHIISLS